MRLLSTLATFGMFAATVHAQFHGQFENVRPVPGLSSPYRDLEPFVTEDGRTIHFQSDRDSSATPVDWTKMNIWTATRKSWAVLYSALIRRMYWERLTFRFLSDENSGSRITERVT